MTPPRKMASAFTEFDALASLNKVNKKRKIRGSRSADFATRKRGEEKNEKDIVWNPWGSSYCLYLTL